MIIFTLRFGDKYEMIKCKFDATFELNICLSISRISRWSYCWHSYRRSSWCPVTCCLYIFWMLPKEEDGGSKVALGSIWGILCSKWARYIYFVLPVFFTFTDTCQWMSVSWIYWSQKSSWNLICHLVEMLQTQLNEVTIIFIHHQSHSSEIAKGLMLRWISLS